MTQGPLGLPQLLLVVAVVIAIYGFVQLRGNAGDTGTNYPL